jgi:hypothetical protein
MLDGRERSDDLLQFLDRPIAVGEGNPERLGVGEEDGLVFMEL